MQFRRVPELDERLRRSGLTLYGCRAIPATQIEEVLRSLAAAFDARLATFDRDSSVLVLAFGAGHATLRAGASSPAKAPPQIVALFDAPLVAGIRLETTCDRDLPTSESEVAMLYAASELARLFECVAYDDAGVVYDPHELDVLGQRSATRAEFSAVRLAAPDVSATNGSGARLTPFDGPKIDLTNAQAPLDALPDLVFTHTAVFGVNGRHLPMVELSRILLAVARDERANPAGRDIAVLSPLLERADRDLLGTLGVTSYDSEAVLRAGVDGAAVDAAQPTRASGRRDELALLVPLPTDSGRVRSILDRFMRDLQTSASVATNPAIPREMGLLTLDEDGGPELPSRIAFFAYPQARVDVYHLELDRAHPVLRRFGRRRQLEALIGRAFTSVILVELLELTDELSGSLSEDYFRADVLSVSLAQLFSSAAFALAVDTSGAIYGADELMRLGVAHQGRAFSWSRRVAAVRRNTATEA